MRKIIPYLLILLFFTFCTKEEFENESTTSQIEFSILNKGTKGSIDGTSIPEGTYFGVYGYTVLNDDYTNKSFLMRNGRFNNNGISETKYYWPYSTEISEIQSNFVAYYPYNLGASESNGVVTVPIDMSSNSDVLYAVNYNAIPALTIHDKSIFNLSFNHVLASLRYLCRFLTTYDVRAEMTGFNFKSNFYTSGNLLIDAVGDKDWNNNVQLTSLAGGTDLSFDSKLILDTAYTEAVDVLLIPQKSPDSLRLVVDLNVSDSSQTVIYKGRLIEVEVPVDTFESGKKYVLKQTIPIYNINFDLVDNWTNPHDTAWQSWKHVTGAEADHYFYKNFSPNAAKFSNEVKGLDYTNGDYIEAQIDLSKLVRAKQNIFSMGEDIANWSPSGSVEKFNFHVYFPNDVNDKRVRFSIVSNNKVSGNTRRTMGIVKPEVFTYDADTNYVVTVRFDKYGFYVNGHLITRDDFDPVEASKTPEWPKNPSGIYPDVWTYPDYFMPHFNVGPLNIQFGSMEGTTRSYADYLYIMYHHNIK